jgi:sugar phosphate isomerase/epimerase
VRPDHSRDSLFAIAEALGAKTVIAAHLTGGTVRADQAIEGFAVLCDDAACHGLRVALEAVPFTGIPTVADAWAIVDAAGRANGGVVFDVVHHARGGLDDGALRAVPPERYFAIQLGDAAAAAPPDLLDEAMYHRRPPGEGGLPVREVLELLADHGVQAPAGPEVYRREWEERHPLDVAQELGRAMDAVLTG